MNAVVFFGPSISPDRVADLISATHAPPVRRGDLARYPHDLVIILDGEFGQSLSVSPKEILAVLDAGRTVIGAASMGALRASELDGHGMIGVGWIYERFKREAVRRDDDVAMTFSPVDGRALTVPMVNVDYWLESLDRRGRLAAGERHRASRAARRIFFAERTGEVLNEALARSIGKDRLAALLGEFGGLIPNIKQIDAVAALRTANTLMKKPHTENTGDTDFNAAHTRRGASSWPKDLTTCPAAD